MIHKFVHVLDNQKHCNVFAYLIQMIQNVIVPQMEILIVIVTRMITK
jgi:hypothetical protein